MKYIDADKLIAVLERQNTAKNIIEPLIRIIDSLQEQPMEGLEEYCPYKTTVESILKMFDSYSITTDKSDFIDNIRVKCKDAVEYDKLFPKRRRETEQPASEELEEAANNFAIHYDNGTCDGIAQDCFIAGAEWDQAKMMEGAVEADVNTYKDPILSCGWAEFVVDMPSTETDKLGDKVRIIVIKEDEK